MSALYPKAVRSLARQPTRDRKARLEEMYCGSLRVATRWRHEPCKMNLGAWGASATHHSF
jgi:hypothetical protein